MLIERERHEGIRRGETTVLFRRWAHRQATAGRVYRTALGRVAVDEIDVVRPDDITADDAARAGYGSARAVVEDLRGGEGDPIYRLRIRYVEGPDPRDVLAATEHLTGDGRRDLDERLARLDRSAPAGPWTHAALRLIQRRPGVRAGDLAAELGHDPVTFKTGVRKLKNLGLTISLPTGYTLSPRGRAYLADG
jgi:hypothetical protein